MDENNQKTNSVKWIDSSIVILFFAGILSFLLFTGTLNSGYHFIDDHEMLHIHSDLEKMSFIDTSIHWIKSDLIIRFRPMYFFHRVLEMKIFGDNFFVLSFYTGLLAASAFSFFYFGARKLKYSIFESLLFVFLAFIGSQMAVWWRLGPSESVGMLFLGLSFLFMAKCLNKKRYKINNILFIIFLIITSLCKESLVIIVPAFVLFKVWNEKRVFQITAKESIKNNLLLVFPIIIMFFELLIIKFFVGTNKIGYAGMTSSANEFIVGIKNMLFGENSLFDWMKLLSMLVLIYFISFLFNKESRKEKFIRSVKYLSLLFLFSLMIVLPNIFMYAKSGMFERYLLPTTLGMAFLAISILQRTKQKFFRWLIFLAIFVFIATSFNTAKTDAVAFANEGKRTNELLSAIADHAGSNPNIIVVADPASRYEISFSLKAYLSSRNIGNLYGYPIARDYTTDFERGLEQGWMSWFENKTIEDINGQPDQIVIIDKNQAVIFFDQSGVSELNYENILGSDNPSLLYIKR